MIPITVKIPSNGKCNKCRFVENDEAIIWCCHLYIKTLESVYIDNKEVVLPCKQCPNKSSKPLENSNNNAILEE